MYNNTFYCFLDPSVIWKSNLFKKNTAFYIAHLKFIIRITSSTGKTYAYPRIKIQKSTESEDVMVNACYMFACVNYAINFFAIAINESSKQDIVRFAVQEKVEIREINIE